ncbi:sensor histidine kinase [uncultured Mucilaginibacter sp.]|uniref:ligand-binding sensor domain-containing protein n=1 Tax=uncultured Mucilaginibacter sp. TaxID=797541 RepID=UPI0025F38D51|nr:sensor histidine kinase [uncultured Mucilaginibacter sp.]
MRLFLRAACVVVLLIGAVFACFGQSYYFKHYQVDDGLSHNAVTSILQDSKGLMWIGTRGGLNRFDGYTFKLIKNKKNKLGNLGNNVITAIKEDRKGMLWIGTGKGIFKYDPYKEVLTSLDVAPQSYIRSLLIDLNGNLWFLADYSLFRYNQQKNKVEDASITGTCTAVDKHNNILIGNNDGEIIIYSPTTKKIKYIRAVGQSIQPKLRSINKIYPLEDGRILIGCFKQGLKIFDPSTRLTRSIPLREKNDAEIYVRDITSASKTNYWIATESGVFIYNLLNNKSLNVRKSSEDPYAIADNAVYAVCKDNQGGMWAGTYFGGLNYYSKENARFEKYYPQVKTNSISGDAVREIRPDNNGNLWIGTEDAGINKLDLNTGKFSNFTSTGSTADLSYPNIHGLLSIGNELLIGPFFHGMEIMDTKTGKITSRFKYIGNKDDNASDFILCMHLTRDSTILIGTAYNGSGLFTYNRKQKTFSRIKQIPYDSYVFHIAEDNKGNIWTGSVSQGAFYYNPKTGKTDNIRFGTKINNKYINEVAVHYIMQDSNGNMWFATEGAGLIKLSPDLKTFKRFTTTQGMPTNVIFCMLEDGNKNLWVSTLRGLICLNLKTEKFKTYTQSNGLITDQFNYNSAYKHPSGKMYFGSVKGMVAFNPAEFAHKDASPPTYITGFQINNKEIVPNDKTKTLTRSILYTDTITLNHNQSNFSIEFAALNYSSPQVTRYKYFMAGLDKQWTYLNSNRKAYFTDLSAGDYTFHVQAESNVGSWVGKERRIFIKVLPPFWKSNTAYAFYILATFISLYLAVRYYHQYLERKNHRKIQLFEHEKEKEIYQAKIEFFTNIAHEIQTPLTLIVGPVEWLVKKAEEQPSIKKSLLLIEKNAKRLTELTAQLLDFRKTEMNQFGLNFVNTDISKLLKEQLIIFKPEALKGNISLEINIPKQPAIAFVDREALVKILTNLISNAIKYAAAKATVTLNTINANDEHFTIWFSNDGKGIPADLTEKVFEPFFRVRGHEKPGTGIGLSLARSLAELHNGSLKLIKGKSNITVFELTLPVHQKFEFNLSSWKKIK